MKGLFFALIFLAYCIFYSFSKSLLRRGHKNISQTSCFAQKGSLLGLCRLNKVEECYNHHGRLGLFQVHCIVEKIKGKDKCRNGSICI